MTSPVVGLTIGILLPAQSTNVLSPRTRNLLVLLAAVEVGPVLTSSPVMVRALSLSAHTVRPWMFFVWSSSRSIQRPRVGCTTIAISSNRNWDKQPSIRRPRRAVALSPLGPTVADSLRDHRRAQNEWRLSRGPKWNVSPDQKGNRLTHRNIARRVFKAILEKADLPDDFNIYCLRHSMTTLLLQRWRK